MGLCRSSGGGGVFSLRDHISSLTGVVLLCSAFSLLLLAPADFSALNFAAFMLSFVLGILLLSGIIGTDPVSRRSRRQAGSPHRDSREPIPEVNLRTYRYPSRPVLYRALSLSFFGLLLISIAYWPMLKRRPTLETDLAALLALLGGIVGAAYFYRFPRTFIQTEKSGLRARSWLGEEFLPWGNIVALVRTDVPLWLFVGPSVGQIYRVYSLDDRLEFFHSLENASDLAAVIEQASKQKWDFGHRSSKLNSVIVPRENGGLSDFLPGERPRPRSESDRFSGYHEHWRPLITEEAQRRPESGSPLG